MTRDLPFRPVNSAHAIVECTIFVEFVPAFSHTVRERFVNNLASQLQNDLPKANVQKVLETEINIQEGKPSGTLREELNGVELQRIKSDGSLEWMLRTTENIVSVHCLNYTRWNDIWPEAKRYLQFALRQVRGSDNFVSSIGIKYIDRFVYDGINEDYQVSNLFSEETDLISKRLFSKGPLWHSHTGWFANIVEIGSTCLNQLNVDATYANFSGLRKPVVTIEHNVILNEDKNSDSISSYLDYEGGNENNARLDQIMRALHMTNKNVLSSLLNSEMKRKINLDRYDAV